MLFASNVVSNVKTSMGEIHSENCLYFALLVTGQL